MKSELVLSRELDHEKYWTFRSDIVIGRFDFGYARILTYTWGFWPRIRGMEMWLSMCTRTMESMMVRFLQGIWSLDNWFKAYGVL